MERKKKNRALELGKDLLIVVLVLLAVYLTLRTQLSAQIGGGEPPRWLAGVLTLIDRGPGSQPAPGEKEGQTVEVRPLRIAVNIVGVGRYGVQYDSTVADKLFDEVLSTILGEALGSARTPQSVTEQEWQDALSNRSGIYLDFQGQIPIGALYAWLGAGPGEALVGVSARRLLLAEDESGSLVLYYSNEDTGMYYACQTADTLKGHLQTVVTTCTSHINEATFAYERKGAGYKALEPYVLLPGTAVLQRSVYRAENPIAGGAESKNRTQLIAALGFHPQANSSYVAGGRQVVKEGADTLILHDDGTVEYHSASPEEAKYPAKSGAEGQTAQLLMETTLPLAEKAAGAIGGAAELYLIGIEDLGDGRWQVDYGYHLDGVTVRLGAEGYAARYIVADGRVSDFSIMLRSYTATGTQSAVLPERQAAAAVSAMGARGQALTLVYEDSGSVGTVQCGWIAE